MKNAAYSALGGYFEYFNRDCDYELWSQYLIKKLKEANASGRGVDMGCGNGYFTRAIYRAGYDVCGMDISAEMLSRAVEYARKEGVKAEFLSGDITKFKLNFKAGFVTAVNDCINYVPPQKLKSTFAGVYKNLAAGGVFIFDISTPEKLKNTVGNNTFFYDLESAACVWCNALKEDRVDMDITVFIKGADGRYERRDESQTQYIHGVTDILQTLKEVGFKVKCEGHLGGGDFCERANFICTKRVR